MLAIESDIGEVRDPAERNFLTPDQEFWLKGALKSPDDFKDIEGVEVASKDYTNKAL